MANKIIDIEGVGPAYAEKLKAAGIATVSQLLAKGASRKGREELVQQTGINDGHILRWVNLCDLCRIKGVSTQYSELLEAAGVDTVKELRNRNADNLTQKMAEVNTTRRLVRRAPTLKEVSSWVEQAKALPPTITH